MSQKQKNPPAYPRDFLFFIFVGNFVLLYYTDPG